MKFQSLPYKPVLWCAVLIFSSGMTLTVNESRADDDDEDSSYISKEQRIIDNDTDFCVWDWRYHLLLMEMKHSTSHPDYVRMKKQSEVCTKREDEAANDDNTEAIYRIAARYNGGYGLYEYNREKRRQLLKKVLKETDEDSTRYKNIKIDLKRLAQQEKNGRPDVIPANIMKTMGLASRYENNYNKNFPKDIEKARQLYGQVRQAGFPEAAYKLYQLYEGTEKGKQLLIEAAEKGWVPAMGDLAFNLKIGTKGFERDLDAAEKWAKLTLARDPKSHSGTLVMKTLPRDRKYEQQRLKKQAKEKAKARRKQILERCRKPAKLLQEKKLANGYKQVTLQSSKGFSDIYTSCTFTVSGIKDKSGRWNGPYKVVRDLDGFEIFKGDVKNGKLSGKLVVMRQFPRGYDVKRNPGAGANSLFTLGPPIDVNSATVAFELYDYDFLKGRKPHYYFQKINIVDDKMVNMKEVTTDGVLLYEGTASRGGVKQSVEIGKTNTIGNFARYGEKWFDLDHGADRLNGRCLYAGKMEPCSYRYVNALKGTYKVLRRMDPIGQERRRQYLADLNIQIQNYGYAKQKVARLSLARERNEAREKRESAARQARDKANRERWAREAAEDRRRLEQDQARMFNQTFRGSTSSSSSDINDPLNPNNPINRQMQQQTQRALQNHANQQAQAKRDYQAKLAQRKREIEAQKRASIERRQAQQQANNQTRSSNSSGLSGPGSTRYSKPTSTHKQFMTSKIEDQYAKGRDGWDCVNHWRADKCGDRIVTHNIHPFERGRTTDGRTRLHPGAQGNGSSGSTGNSSTDYASNGNNQNGAGQTPPTESKQEVITGSFKLKGDSSSYYYDKNHAIDLAQTEVMNNASKRCGTSYKAKLAWHDHLLQCKQLNKQFRCKTSATVTCLAKSCGSRFCGTAR